MNREVQTTPYPQKSQLVLDLVPYDCNHTDPHTIILHANHYAKKLEVKSRFNEKYAGFTYHPEEGEPYFVYVLAYPQDGTVEFHTSVQGPPIDLDALAQFFQNYLHALDSIGYEVLDPDP